MMTHPRRNGTALECSPSDYMETPARAETPTERWRPLPPIENMCVEIPTAYTPRQALGKYAAESASKRRAAKAKDKQASRADDMRVSRTEGPKRRKTAKTLNIGFKRWAYEWSAGGLFEEYGPTFEWWCDRGR